MRRVLLMVIDALASAVFGPALESGRLPSFRLLAERGRLDLGCTAIFPSITPAATCSIVTGRYPFEHGIVGNYWYDPDAQEVSYYGDDFRVIAERGVGTFFEDFLVKLNFERLSAATIFEMVEKEGRDAACLNYLWFRGEHRHDVTIPWLLKLLPGMPASEEVKGPRILCLGDFVTTRTSPRGRPLRAPGGIFRRFGFRDETTASHLLELARRKALPDFTLAYFPDNDYRSHRVGPQDALEVVERIDRHVGRLFEIYGGVDRFLQEVSVIVTGDHSQSPTVSDEKERGIDLNEVLSSLRLAAAGSGWSSEDEIMACPNMRAAQIYTRPDGPDLCSRVARVLLEEPRIDQVLCDRVDEESGYRVSTRDRGALELFRADASVSAASLERGVDVHGTAWSWRGDLRAVDATLSEDGVLAFGEYPNAFQRIAGCFDARASGTIWATARPGYEFCLPRTETHPGGSHGSLHAEDSTVPLLVAGALNAIEWPVSPRCVDVMPLCLALLGIRAPVVVS